MQRLDPPEWSATHLRAGARFVLAAGSASLFFLLACRDAAPTAQSVDTIPVQRVTLTSSADTVVPGERVVLTAAITADRAVPEAWIRWSAVPNLPLNVDQGRLTAQVAAETAGRYTITVRAGDKSAYAILQVLDTSQHNPQWRLVSLGLRPDTGGDPEPVPFNSGWMEVLPSGAIHIVVVYPENYYFDSSAKVLDYPVVRDSGNRLTLCRSARDPYCDSATWTLDGDRLYMVGPEGDFAFPEVVKRGMPEWVFERRDSASAGGSN